MPSSHPDNSADFSFRALLEAQTARDGGRPFFTFARRTWTAAEMDAGANRVANALRVRGVRHRDHVAVLLPNGPEIVWCWWGIAKLGAVYVPVNTQLVGESLAHVLRHSDATVLVAAAALVDQVQAALDPAWPEWRRTLRVVTPDDLLAGAGDEAPPYPDERADDPALIIYTSGTTGQPKGVLWSRQAQTFHARRYAEELNCAEPGEAVYTCLPFFHVTSIGVSISSFLRGARVAVDSSFDPFGHWRRIREEGAVLFPYVGAILSLLHKRPRREDDADNPVRWAMGAAAPKEIWRDVEERFGMKVIETYGQTKFAGHWLMRPLADRGPGGRTDKLGTVGTPPPRLEAWLEDEAGAPVTAADVPGELVVRASAPHLLMDGYYKQPEATAHAFRGGTYHTGDRLSRDAEAYFTYLKDFIRHRGENVSAFEIERAVTTHPSVLECAALGVPSEMGEEDVLLCVVPRDGEAIEPAALYEYCRERLAAFMLPRYVQLMDSLPKTATQRTQKYKLAEAFDPAKVWDRQRRGKS
jgi:carnitine-CoA ligase